MKLLLGECQRRPLMIKLVQVMVWCCQATSHYLSQCWLRSVSAYFSLGQNELILLLLFHLLCLLHCLFICVSDIVDGYYRDFLIYRALEAIILQIHQTNAFVQRNEPWRLQKTGTEPEWLQQILAVAMETLRVTGILLQPVIPNIASKLLDRLNVANTQRTYTHAQGPPGTEERHLGENHGVLLPRIKSWHQF